MVYFYGEKGSLEVKSVTIIIFYTNQLNCLLILIFLIHGFADLFISNHSLPYLELI